MPWRPSGGCPYPSRDMESSQVTRAILPALAVWGVAMGSPTLAAGSGAAATQRQCQGGCEGRECVTSTAPLHSPTGSSPR